MKKYCIGIMVLVIVVTLGIVLFGSENNKREIKIKTANGIINMETYMTNVIINEMDEYTNIEALKAFSVVTRSNLISAVVDNHKKIITDEDIMLNYNKDLDLKKKEHKYISDKITKALIETKGEVILYEDNVIRLPYHKISGGETLNIIKGTNTKIPYLKKTLCVEDRESEDFLKIKYVSNKVGNIEEKIEKELEGVSSNYYIEKIENRIRVVFQGKGHGYGMSLYNANKMGESGSTYREILSKFYKNIKIVRVY